MLILNLKNYEEVARDIDKLVEPVADMAAVDAKYEVIVAAPHTDIRYLRTKYPQVTLAAQNVDKIEPGAETGWVIARNLVEIGVGYTILNHSEHRNPELSSQFINELTAAGLKVILCCQDIEEARRFLEFRPFALAFEPPELIGAGKGVSVMSHAGDLVREFLELVPSEIKAIIGAGITDGSDLRQSYDAGAAGVLLASSYAKSADPTAKLAEFLNA